MGLKKEPEEHVNHERYLVTYADLITLLLAFFIILFASSNLDIAKYKAMAQGFSVAFGGSGSPSVIGNTDMHSAPIVTQPKGDKGTDKGNYIKPPTIAERDKINLAKLKSRIDKVIKARHLESSIFTAYGDRGLVISLSQKVSFESNSAKILPEFKSSLKDVAAILKSVSNKISVEGHTDNTAPTGGRYNSNWQLASARATNVLEYLMTSGGVDPNRLSAVSFGDRSPISTNDTLAGRIKNNRVNIVILSNEYNEKYTK